MEDLPSFALSPSQGVQLLSLAAMICAGDVDFRGYGREDEENARKLIADVAQEIALQVPA